MNDGIEAIRAAGKGTGNYRLTGATPYVTVEPCTMCVGAITWRSRLEESSPSFGYDPAQNMNEERYINRVAYDISSKPPATIEWE